MKKILILSLFTFTTLASEIVYLGRSARAALMGDAWTALANNDEMTLFYNPASLGGNDSIAISPLNPKFGLTNALAEADRFKNFPKDPALVVDRLLGFPIYAEVSAFPGLKMMRFGFNLFVTNKLSLNLRNRVHPSFEIDYRYDRGFTTGFAFNIIGGRGLKGKKIGDGQRLSIGYGLKYIRREGLKDSFDVFGTGLLNKIEAGFEDINDIKEAFGFAEGKAFGHDLGVEYAVGNGTTEIVSGLSILNVGDIQFRKLSGTSDVPKQDMYINAGVAFKQDFTFFDYALSMDIKPINAPIPVGRMIHAGAMLNIPFISLYGGMSEGYLSYGAEVRLFPIKLVVGFYDVELATEFKEEQGKRALIYLSLLDAEFDIF
ncbi:MAG: hypothetical protein BM556_02715 [Bacteriovorax sp. MedPE-SWde]|nr:MAG: hypothetical protein BM556_02715 [Bacteriovorax sp. MedPE-SWde]